MVLSTSSLPPEICAAAAFPGARATVRLVSEVGGREAGLIGGCDAPATSAGADASPLLDSVAVLLTASGGSFFSLSLTVKAFEKRVHSDSSPRLNMTYLRETGTNCGQYSPRPGWRQRSSPRFHA